MGLQIIVVGGGIAGLASACALRGEHDVTIVEQTRFKTETGAAIHLGPNASRLVLAWGCDLNESPQLIRLRESDSQARLQSERTIDAVAEYGTPWLLNHRVTLHQQLLRAATLPLAGKTTPILETGLRVESVDAETGTVVLEGGRTLHGDVVIGADGIKSQVRASLFGSTFTAKPSGHSAYRGLIPAERVLQDEELAPLLSPTGLSIFLAKDRKLVLYSCHFQGHDYLNLVAAVPDAELPETSQESWYQPGKVDDLMTCFRHFHPKLVRLLSYTTECGLWQLRDQDPLKTWTRGRAIVIGDAAHPMLPHMGQGGSQAIEDADMLAYCLTGMSSSTDKSAVQTALERTFRLRYERATVCQEGSREQAFGKRREQLDAAVDIPALNPMQFAAYMFTYTGARGWAEKQERSEQLVAEESKTGVDAVEARFSAQVA